MTPKINPPESTPSYTEKQVRPLEGILIADFSRILAGPYATMLLADMGAEVVKVESPAGDDTRTWMPPVRPDGVSTYYSSINRNKRSVVLDLRDPDDAEAARELARRADVLIENFKPGGLAKLGLGYEDVQRINPAIVYCSISGFGTTKGAHLAGYDLIVQAMSGLMSLTGDPGGREYRAGISVFDVITGLHSAIGIIAALRHRDINGTGAGQHVETSLMTSALSGLVNQTGAFVAGGTVPTRMGNAHPSLFPYEPLPTADDDLVVTAGNDDQFRRLVQVLGIAEIADDPRFSTNGARTANREELRPVLVERLRTRTARHWFTELNAAGVPSGPINTIAQGIEYAEELGLQPVVEVGNARVPGVRNPISFSAATSRYELAPPALGEHTDEIKQWLSDPNAITPTAENPTSARNKESI